MERGGGEEEWYWHFPTTQMLYERTIYWTKQFWLYPLLPFQTPHYWTWTYTQTSVSVARSVVTKMTPVAWNWIKTPLFTTPSTTKQYRKTKNPTKKLKKQKVLRTRWYPIEELSVLIFFNCKSVHFFLIEWWLFYVYFENDSRKKGALWVWYSVKR